MISRYTRLRVRRKIRNQKKTLGKVSEQAGDQFETNVLGRWRNLAVVRRFAFGWLFLVAMLILGVFLQGRELDSYHLTQVPVSGGTFREGVVGDITNVNPIFATRASDRAATKLIFSSLFTYDTEGKIAGDLAESYTINADGRIYTVKLRKDVQWHDGDQFDANDVVFTYEAIQHPDTRSYLNVAWRDVKVQMVDDYTVTFTLPNPFTPFIHSLAQGGIIPVHILGELAPAQIRGDAFNTSTPIGTGPFMFKELLGEAEQTTVNERQLRLDKYPEYHRGEPKVDHFVLATFSDREVMIERFLDGELAAIGGLTTDDRELILEAPQTVWHDLPLNNIVFMFYKTDTGELESVKVRRALSQATNPIDIQTAVKGRFALADAPFLPIHVGYDEAHVQLPYNKKAAEDQLREAGYTFRKGDDNDGFRYKDGKRLEIEIVTQNTDDYPAVAQTVADNWKEVGVDASVRVVADDEIQRNNISPHNYEALLFGISLGADPDSFVYWHSSQSGVNGFNLSEIQDIIIDEALESGRTRVDEELRAIKYQAFLDQWRKLAPATALYQPAYSYANRRSVDGFVRHALNTPEDRYANVHNWRVNTREGIKPY